MNNNSNETLEQIENSFNSQIEDLQVYYEEEILSTIVDLVKDDDEDYKDL